MGKFTKEVNDKLLIEEKERYPRDQFNTYMNTFEWENVEDAKRIGAFMEEDKSIFYFPFLRRTFNLLWVTKNSVSAANQYDSMYKIMASEYGLMAGFINFFNALEFLPMGIAGLFVRRIVNEKNDTPMQKHFAQYFKKYGADLETIPFYDHNYTEIRSQLSEAYQIEKTNNSLSVNDRLTYAAVNIQLIFRKWVSIPLQYMYHQPDNIVPPTTDVLVRYRPNDMTFEADAKDAFMGKIDLIKEAAHVDLVGSHVYTKKRKNDQVSVFALLSTPRYRAFKETTAVLGQEKIEIRKIAGNDNIQVKCDMDAKDEDAFTQAQEALKNTKNAHLLFQFGDSIHSNRQTFVFNVPVTGLQNAVPELEQIHEDVKVSFIHNF